MLLLLNIEDEDYSTDDDVVSQSVAIVEDEDEDYMMLKSFQ